ncbi:TraI domain-containing protein [Thiomicrorhabdus sp. Milos-T2]|uniref:TraI domain-containing protein n=1 Tax=Thiomicrorhabdus sp. Milos-T2 TaxID=90814 RepID=UPI000494ABDF|nr:TraI domain-containing protein [Thiomicrorhabdus sp. Milos-T2]
MNLLNNFSEKSALIKNNGKQVFGYAGTFLQDPSYTGFNDYLISVIDEQSNTHCFRVNQNTYGQIIQKYNALKLQHNDFIYFWIEVTTRAEILNWRLFKSPLTIEQINPIYKSCYDFDSLYHLFEIVESITLQPLKRFMIDVLSSNEHMQDFVSLPASKQHHHSFPGGLISHSIECALMTYQTVISLSSVSKNEAEVAMIAALLHDFGKIKTLGFKTHTSLGRLVDHEQLTLMLLNDSLQKLTNSWQQGAETLQYLLLWKERMGVCRFVSGNAIKMADHLSTSASLRMMAFKNKPGYFHFAELNIGTKKHYLNRLN